MGKFVEQNASRMLSNAKFKTEYDKEMAKAAKRDGRLKP